MQCSFEFLELTFAIVAVGAMLIAAIFGIVALSRAKNDIRH